MGGKGEKGTAMIPDSTGSSNNSQEHSIDRMLLI